MNEPAVKFQHRENGVIWCEDCQKPVDSYTYDTGYNDPLYFGGKLIASMNNGQTLTVRCHGKTARIHGPVLPPRFYSNIAPTVEKEINPIDVNDCEEEWYEDWDDDGGEG